MARVQQEFLILTGALNDYGIDTIVEILNIHLRRAVDPDIKLKRPSTSLLEELVAITIEIHPFLLSGGRVFCRDQAIPLYPSILKLLYILAKDQGTLVTHTTIARLLWPDDSLVDSEYNIKKSISQLRKAFSPFIEEPREYLKNIPGLGYILIPQKKADSNGASNENSVSEVSALQLGYQTQLGIGDHT